MLSAVVAGGLACMFFEYAGKVAPGPEPQAVADLVYCGLGIRQQIFCPLQLGLLDIVNNGTFHLLLEFPG